MGKNNGRTTDKVIPGAQTRPAEADTKRESAGVNDAAGPKPADADGDAADETDQSQGGGNPHVPTPKADAKPSKAQADKHDRDHERVKVRVLRPIVENGLHHPVGAFFETTRMRAAALGDLVRVEK